MPDLGPVGHGCTRIRRKFKTIPQGWGKGGLGCRRTRCHRYGSRRILDKISSEGAAVIETPLLTDTRPMNAKRIDHSTHKPKRVQRIKTVRHRNRFDDTAQALELK